MKETYFLIHRDYMHVMRLIAAAWENKKPRQLEAAIDTLKNYIPNATTRVIEDV